jgi:putative transposase
MGRNRYKFVEVNKPHLMTCTVLHWIPVFTRTETVGILQDSLRYLINDGLKVYAYVVLENHMHIIAQSHQMNKDIARFKSFTAKKLFTTEDTENNEKIVLLIL